MLNTNGMQADFVQYLRENGLLEAADVNKQVGLINIENYSSEMADFLQAQYGLESDLVSVEIEDLDDLQFDRAGNLVNDNEFNIDEVRNMDMNDAQNQKGVLAGFLGMLVNTGNTRMQIDANGDGNISEDEMEAFLNTVDSKDGKVGNLSLNDIFGSMDQISNNTFRIGDLTAAGADFAARTPAAPAVTQPPAGTVPALTGLDKFTDDQLKTESQNQNAGLTTANAQLQAARSGSDPTLQGMAQTREYNQKAWVDAMAAKDASLAEIAGQISTKLDEIEQCESAITAKEQEINDAEIEIGKCDDLDKQLTEQITAIDGKITSIQSNISALSTMPAAATDAERSSRQQSIASLNSTLTDLKAEKQKMEDDKKANEDKKKELEDTKQKLENEKIELQHDLDNYNSQLDTLMNDEKVAEAMGDANIAAAYNAYTTSANNYNSTQRQMQENATAAVKTYNSNLSNIETEQNVRAINNAQDENSFNYKRVYEPKNPES